VSYLTFNLAGAPVVSSAVLQLTGGESPGAREASIQVGVFPVSAQFGETTINFTNAPALGTGPLATAKVVGLAAHVYSLDVTAYLKQRQAAGATSVTLAVAGLTKTLGFATFHSREASSGKPGLVLNGSATPTRRAFNATADAYVQNGSFGNTNHGSANPLLVKDAVSPFDRVAYLSFNLGSLGAGSVGTATLNLFGGIQNSDGSPLLIQVLAGSGGFNENTINFNNAPATGATLASTVVTGTTPRVYGFDLTGFVKSELAHGNSTFTLAVAGTTFTTQFFAFNSKEAASNGPQLIVTT
jgi:hypothetical protein